MASVVLMKEQLDAIDKAKAAVQRRVRVELTSCQQEAKADADVERERHWIDAKSTEARQKHDTRVQHIAALLRDAREAAGLSLTELAERTGITRQAISRIESGDNRNSTLSTIVRMAEALNKEWAIELPDVA